MKSKTPAWMTETLNLSSDFVSFIKLHIKIGEKLSEMANIFNLHYYAFQQIVIKYYEHLSVQS